MSHPGRPDPNLHNESGFGSCKKFGTLLVPYLNPDPDAYTVNWSTEMSTFDSSSSSVTSVCKRITSDSYIVNNRTIGKLSSSRRAIEKWIKIFWQCFDYRLRVKFRWRTGKMPADTSLFNSINCFVYIFLFVFPSACLPTCLSVCLSVFLSVCLSACLSASLPACLPVCLTFYPSICPPVCLPYCLHACLSCCLACLALCLPVCLPACPFVSVCLSAFSVYVSVRICRYGISTDRYI
jgi:hypothetical protein